MLFTDAKWPVQGHSIQISESGFGDFFCLVSNAVAFPLSQGDWIWTKRSCLEREFKGTGFCSGNLKTQETRRGSDPGSSSPLCCPCQPGHGACWNQLSCRDDFEESCRHAFEEPHGQNFGFMRSLFMDKHPQSILAAGHYCSLPQFALRPRDSHYCVVWGMYWVRRILTCELLVWGCNVYKHISYIIFCAWSMFA